ncbi:amidohydrolase [Pendulispora albinea]|uniref:Amidohydrolase n=1 Tax=Pendulispora albinea TaxID=2741071 RepID=A0ABZ2LV11_9BACT
MIRRAAGVGMVLVMAAACGGAPAPGAKTTSGAERGQAEPASDRGAVVSDLVLLHGRIFTADAERPEVQALAIWRGRVLAVGGDDDIRPLIGAQTRVIDLANRRAVPGMRDSHVHFLSGGLELSRVALKDAANEAELGRRLVEYDRKLAPGRWMLGGRWEHEHTLAGRLPDAALLDKYVPNRPVFLSRYDGHMAVANSRALAIAGIDARTADPPGGAIVRKPGSRTPTGILRDNAMDLVWGKVPPLGDDEIVEAVRAATREAHRSGVTAVEDMDGSDPATRARLLGTYQRLAQSGELGVRVALYWPLADYGELARAGVRASFGSDWVRIGGVKGFVDGSIGSSTAKMFTPYLNEPDSTGLFVTQPEKLREWIGAADSAGLAVAVHAIGDRANADLLSIFAQVAQKNGGPPHRFRIEHAQILRPEDLTRFASSGVIASMQPYHAVDDGGWIERRIGAARLTAAYAWRSLLDKGATLAFGSDWPVAPLSPLTGIDAAVNRRTLDGKHPEGWFPAERISAREAVVAYTRSAAFAARRELDEGSLAPGKLGDVVVLSHDILDPAARNEIATAHVMLTIAGGQVVHEQSSSSPSR